MATRSFRIFATKEDLSAIFSDFQKSLKVQYFACGRMNELREICDITNTPLFGINKNGNHVNNQWLICCENVMPLKRKNNRIVEKDIFFIDQELNSSSIIVNLGGVYENQVLFPTEISTIWFENEESKELYTLLKKSCKKFTKCTQNGYMIGENAYLNKMRYRFCTISIDSPEIYDLKVE